MTGALDAAAWCIKCGALPELAITVERRGVLAHYGSCWQHVTDVADRARYDAARAELEAARQRVINTGAAFITTDTAEP